MIGTALNVAGILIGGLTGLVRRRPLSPANESFFKVGLGVFTVFYGLRLTWISLNGSFLQILKQLLVAVLALMLGRMTGRLLRLQKMSNHLGRQAWERIVATKLAGPSQVSEGFKTCAALFCAAPLAPPKFTSVISLCARADRLSVASKARGNTFSFKVVSSG